MKLVKTILLSSVLVGLYCNAAALESGNPAEVGVLPQRLSRIDNTINEAIANGEIPGAVALIAKDGKIFYHKAFGYADIASGKPMDTNTIFRIASMTKAVVSAAVMILYERSDFLLNDPVSKYLPEYADMTVVSTLDDDGLVAETVSLEVPVGIETRGLAPVVVVLRPLLSKGLHCLRFEDVA